MMGPQVDPALLAKAIVVVAAPASNLWKEIADVKAGVWSLIAAVALGFALALGVGDIREHEARLDVLTANQQGLQRSVLANAAQIRFLSCQNLLGEKANDRIALLRCQYDETGLPLDGSSPLRERP